MRRWISIMGWLLAAGLVCGCSEKLEDGYEPRRLGSSAAERRAYYASPYTPEAIAVPKMDAGVPDAAQRPPGR